MASLPLLSDSGPRLVGIARLASQGESVRLGHEVEYFTLPVRSVLNRCTGERMPFTWTINPYRGCEFACKYCYARYTHEFMELRDGMEFEQKIYVKQHAAELLRQELRTVKAGEDIAIGTATDPYQPIERRLEVTRTILEELARHSGLVLGIVTKSAMVVRDIDLLVEISQQNRISVSFTVTTVDPSLARILEPRAPRPDLRLEALGKLREAMVPAGVICAPVLPGITDSPSQLEAVVRAAAEAQWAGPRAPARRRATPARGAPPSAARRSRVFGSAGRRPAAEARTCPSWPGSTSVANADHQVRAAPRFSSGPAGIRPPSPRHPRRPPSHAGAGRSRRAAGQRERQRLAAAQARRAADAAYLLRLPEYVLQLPGRRTARRRRP